MRKPLLFLFGPHVHERVMGLWPGDPTCCGTVCHFGPGNERDAMLLVAGVGMPNNVVSNVYSTADLNLDGQVKYLGSNNDRDIILRTIGGSVPTNTRTQQLP